MRTLLIIIFLSAAALIPDVRSAVSGAITDTREAIFANLYNKSLINKKAQQRQRLDITTPAQTSRPSSASEIKPIRPSATANVSDELRANRWTTTKEIYY